jgi:hypothetical protein
MFMFIECDVPAVVLMDDGETETTMEGGKITSKELDVAVSGEPVVVMDALMVCDVSFWFATTVVQETLVVLPPKVFVVFSSVEKPVGRFSVALPVPERPETVTVNETPFITVLESAPAWDIVTDAAFTNGKIKQTAIIKTIIFDFICINQLP